MADEQDKWLDRDAAERLLRGEPLEGVDPHARAKADRLAQALGALAAADGPAARAQTDGTAGAAAGELPGEAAALAAFRVARAASAQPGPRSAAYATPAHETAAAESVRRSRTVGRPEPSRWGRPVRFGLAAALAGCMVGGVAVAAGTGVLPSPFSRHDERSPAASASPVDTSEVPSASPSDGTGESGEAGESAEGAESAESSRGAVGSSPEDGTVPGDEPTRAPGAGTSPEDDAGGDHTDDATRRPADDGTPPGGGTKDVRRKVVAACRDYRSGELRGDRRRHLEEVAQGATRVEEFCGRVLGGNGGGPGNGGQGQGQGGGKSGSSGGDGNSGDGGEEGGGSGGGTGGAAPVPPPPPALPEPVSTGSYSALPHLP
ncbi:hypothetical protein ACOBQB_33015 [Streptomyces sp. G5(2025)]|uniref:hypothetical protein n=1 Tax=Streptomyces sp. G5(2025) TaxID=3406628 RepID=UPI003C25B600